MPKIDRLDALEIRSPCPVAWDSMTGDDRSRFCATCKLHVFDLGGLTSAEALDLISSKEGRLCLRFFRRADGRVLTRDCAPLRAARARKAAAVAIAASLLLAAYASGVKGGTDVRARPAPSALAAICSTSSRAAFSSHAIAALRASPFYDCAPFAAVVDWIDATLNPTPVMGIY
ncbi:MAG: hypothetical protein U0166_04060 [Acidobacteriota bacterium]